MPTQRESKECRLSPEWVPFTMLKLGERYPLVGPIEYKYMQACVLHDRERVSKRVEDTRVQSFPTKVRAEDPIKSKIIRETANFGICPAFLHCASSRACVCARSCGDQLVKAEMQPGSEKAPSRISSGSGVCCSGGSSCSTGSEIQAKHVGGVEDNAEPTPLDQSILASAISSGMPTFLLTKGVSRAK